MPTTRVNDLITIASRLSGVSEADIRGGARFQGICRVRQAVMFAAYAQRVHSFPQIGKVFKKDHSTVIHAKNVVPEFMARDPEYRAFVWQILVEAHQSFPFMRTSGVRFEIAPPRPRVYVPRLPKPKPKFEEPIYYGGGYTMNREAIA
jgi:hypothetical protein